MAKQSGAASGGGGPPDGGGAPGGKKPRGGWFGRGAAAEDPPARTPVTMEQSKEPESAAASLRLAPKKAKETRRAKQRRVAAETAAQRALLKRAIAVKPVFVECSVCFESARARPCCGGELCDLCYFAYCPQCGVSVQDQRPVAEKKVASTETFSALDDGVEQYSEKDLKRERAARVATDVQQELAECRICLDPGDKRACCGEVFCNKCYNRNPTCPSCRRLAAKRGLSAFQLRDPGATAVLGGWCLSAWLVLGALGFVLAALSIERLDLRTLHGFRCYGAAPRCDRLRCVEVYGAGGAPAGDLSVPSIATWRDCDLGSVVKMAGPTCVFDRDLFIQSGERMGYDFCVGSNAKAQRPKIFGGEASNAAFSDGVYVFEDNFDWWANSTGFKGNERKSARWRQVLGGSVDDVCGVYTEGHALHFWGPTTREAVTEDLDVRFGGHVNFRLKLAPESDDDGCATNFGADVSLFYRVNGGAWVKVRDFANAKYGYPTFTFATAEIPTEAWSAATAFKISQPAFLRESDHWAIDDVNVFHNFEVGWKTAPQWKDHLLPTSRQDVGVAQCCLQTDQCPLTQDRDLESTRSSAAFRGGCDDVRVHAIDGYDQRQAMKRKIVRMNGAHLYVSLAGLALLYSFLYYVVRTYFTLGVMKLVLPRWFRDWAGCTKKAKVFVVDEDDEDEGSEDGALKASFEIDVDVRWQWRFAGLTLPPYVLAALWALSRSEAYVLYTPIHGWGAQLWGAVWVAPVPESFVLALALYLDGSVLWQVLKYNICLLRRWVPVVHVDTDPLVNAMDIGVDAADPDLHVAMTSMEEIVRFSRGQCAGVAALYGFTVMPWALIALGVDSLRLDYDSLDRIVAPLLGGLVVARAWAGCDVLVKFALGMAFAFSTTPSCRDQVGQAVCDGRTKWITRYTVLCVTLTGLVLLPMDDGGPETTGPIEYFYGTVLIITAAFCYGTIAGCVQSLPATPEFRLTRLDEGLYFTFVDRAKCPCFTHFTECSTMHSRRRVIVLFLEDMNAFVAKLKGEEDAGG